MLVATSVLAFAVIRAMPGDPAEIALAAWNVPATPEALGALRHQWGLLAKTAILARGFKWDRLPSTVASARTTSRASAKSGT